MARRVAYKLRVCFALRHHENNSTTCLAQHLGNFIGNAKESIPAAYDNVEPLIHLKFVKIEMLGQMRGLARTTSKSRDHHDATQLVQQMMRAFS